MQSIYSEQRYTNVDFKTNWQTDVEIGIIFNTRKRKKMGQGKADGLPVFQVTPGSK